MTKETLQSAIQSYVSLNARSVDKVTQGMMAESLTLFLHDAIVKFDKGNIEHGGLITDRDLDKEIRHELIDLLFYTLAKQWKIK